MVDLCGLFFPHQGAKAAFFAQFFQLAACQLQAEGV